MILENWSRDYLIAHDVEVNTHGGDLALMDERLYGILVAQLGEPVIGYVGGIHYQFQPSRQVLADRAVVPRQTRRASDSMTLLLSK